MPYDSIVSLTDQQRADVLEFLRVGRFTKDLAEVTSIEGLDRGSIVRALVTAGLVERVRGEKSGTVYQRTLLGTIALEALREQQEEDGDAP